MKKIKTWIKENIFENRFWGGVIGFILIAFPSFIIAIRYEKMHFVIPATVSLMFLLNRWFGAITKDGGTMQVDDASADGQGE